MLKVGPPSVSSANYGSAQSDGGLPIVRIVVEFLFLHARFIGLMALLGLAGGVFYVATATPLYTATSTLLMDENKVDLFQRPSVVSDPITDNAYIESQIEVLRSETVGREVVRMLGLGEEPPAKPATGVMAWFAANGITPSVWKENLKRVLGLSDPPAEPSSEPQDTEGQIALSLVNLVTVKRLSGTYVVTVSVTAPSAAFAQQLANALPEAYVNADQTAKQASTKRAVIWLDDRLRELRQKSAEAEQAVENFRRDRGGQAADRGLVNSQLRQLESTALSYKNLYDNLQTRYLQAVQEQSFISSKARVISNATRPTSRSAPRTSISLAIGLIFGLAAGIALSLAREALFPAVRSSSALEAATGVQCLTVLENLRRSQHFWSRLRLGLRTKGPVNFVRYVVTNPFSRFSEEMRRLSINLRQRRANPDRATLLGIVSLHPSEGKTTIASNLAQTLGLSGAKTLLVDMDVRNPSLSRAYGPPRDAASVFDSVEQLSNVWRDPLGHVDILSSTNRVDLAHNTRLFESKVLERNFAKLRQHYEFIILDLPPLLAVADADALKHIVDAFVLVAASGQSSASQLEETLNKFDPQRSQTIGAILNMAEVGNAMSYYAYNVER